LQQALAPAIVQVYAVPQCISFDCLGSSLCFIQSFPLSVVFEFPCRAVRNIDTSPGTMTTPKLDTNQWYQICLDGNSKGQCFVGTWLYTGGNTKGATFLNPSNSSKSDQLWAILPVTVNSTTVYTLRTKDSGPNGFLASEYVAEEDTDGKTRPSMFRGDIAVDNVYWLFGGWGDGTFFLTNTANGTDWHMNKKDSGIMAMSPNVTAPQNGQRFGFSAVSKIDDERYSSVNVSLRVL
jgi:hypothetical protein